MRVPTRRVLAEYLLWGGILVALGAVHAATLIGGAVAFGQESEPTWIPGQHGDSAVGAVSEDGRSLAVQWQSVPSERMAGPNGTWVGHTITQDRSGAVHFSSAHLNATLYRQDCTLRTPDGGRVIHRLMTAPPIGPWSIHEASYLECRIAIDPCYGPRHRRRDKRRRP